MANNGFIETEVGRFLDFSKLNDLERLELAKMIMEELDRLNLGSNHENEIMRG